MDCESSETRPVGHLAVGQRVRLLNDAHGLPSGSLGVVVGFYARAQRTVAVKFDAGVVEVEPGLLQAADTSA